MPDYLKCILCESLSLLHICKTCQKNFLSPSIFKRRLEGIDVISFYKYEDIKHLLHTKHTDIGYYIYKILAKNSFSIFSKEFTCMDKLASISIDDNPQDGYSHTAILNRSLKSNYIHPLYNKLRAKNQISYSGKTKEFRLKNKRDFHLSSINAKEIILVDDIITTGTTLSEAIRVIKSNKKEVTFCLTLADANLKDIS